MLFANPQRRPLGELPLSNFVERRPSPVKSDSSPAKIAKAVLSSPPKQAAVSPLRTNSAPTDSPSGRRLFREMLRGRESEVPLDQSPPTETKQTKTRTPVQTTASRIMSPHFPSSPRSPVETAAYLASPAKSSSSVPQSLGRKKDRVRRQLLDEGEGGGSRVASDIRAGSPSPSKMKAEREVALRGSAASLQSSDVGLGILTEEAKGKQREEPSPWTVWKDDEEALQAQLSPTDVSAVPAVDAAADEDDEGQENIQPALHAGPAAPARKKGTGGRLSLLATADELDGEPNTDAEAKRRRVTPQGV